MNHDPVSDSEVLARFIAYGGWIRKDKTVRQDAFIPYPHSELSVTRHLSLSEAEIWNLGKLAIGDPPRQLHGRADITAINVRNQDLNVESQPVVGNPNHAVIINWPNAKDAQKVRALELAAAAKFVSISEQ